MYAEGIKSSVGKGIPAGVGECRIVRNYLELVLLASILKEPRK